MQILSILCDVLNQTKECSKQTLKNVANNKLNNKQHLLYRE